MIADTDRSSRPCRGPQEGDERRLKNVHQVFNPQFVDEIALAIIANLERQHYILCPE